MGKLRNVVVIADNANVDGGAIQIAVVTAKVLSDAGYNVIYFAGVGEPDSMLEGIRVVTAQDYASLDNPSKVHGALQGIWSARTKDKLMEILRELSPSDTVVHIHNWTHTLSPSVFSAVKKAGFRCVVTLHDYFVSCPNGGLYNYVDNVKCDIQPMSMRCIRCNCDKRSYAQKLYRCVRVFVQKRCLANCDVRFLHLSRFSYELLKSRCLFSGDPIFLPNPIELKKSEKPGANREKQDGYLFVGRLVPEKSPELFCEAVSRARVRATVVGDGPMAEQLKMKYPSVNFVGWVDSEKVSDYYDSHRALILSSGCYEASPLVCAEALVSAGMPSIVPSSCGAIDYIKDGFNGAWFESGNVESLIAAILKLEDDSYYGALLENISKSRGDLVEERSFMRYLENLTDIYEGALHV